MTAKISNVEKVVDMLNYLLEIKDSIKTESEALKNLKNGIPVYTLMRYVVFAKALMFILSNYNSIQSVPEVVFERLNKIKRLYEIDSNAASSDLDSIIQWSEDHIKNVYRSFVNSSNVDSAIRSKSAYSDGVKDFYVGLHLAKDALCCGYELACSKFCDGVYHQMFDQLKNRIESEGTHNHDHNSEAGSGV